MFLKQLNNRGAALLQVLIVSAILAGLATMILRVSLSRTLAAKQARHAVTAQKMIESCMAEVNMLWASKATKAYAEDLAACRMCDTSHSDAGCSSTSTSVAGRTFNSNKVYACSTVGGADGVSASVYAVMVKSGSQCVINYVIPGGVEL